MDDVAERKHALARSRSPAVADRERLDALFVRLHRRTIFTLNSYAEEQLGLLYVATAVRAAGYAAGVVDQPAMSFGELAGIVHDRRAPVVGFYVDHENVFPTMSVADRLRKMYPALLIVVGGPQGKEWHQRILRESACDVACRGEGERAMVAIMDAHLRRSGAMEDIAGITWRRPDGVICVNGDALPVDLDAIPAPDRSLNLSKADPGGVESIMTGRGCPFRCSFCYEGRAEAKYRSRDMANILAEIRSLIIERRVKYLVILDDVFLLNPKHAIAFARSLRALLHELSWSLGWFCEARADIICKRPDMLRECVESGLQRVQIGVETGNQGVLDAYNKSLELEETLGAVRLCNEAGLLSVVGNFIVGGAHETWDTVHDSIDFARQLLRIAPGRMDVNSTIFTPYPGTPMYERPELYGIELIDRDCVSGPGDNHPFHRTTGLDRWEIVEARERFHTAVDEEMTALLPKIPMALAERHFKAYTEGHLRTRWFDHFCKHFNWYNYVGMPMSSPDILRLADIASRELRWWKPLRTLFLGTTRDARQVVNAGHRRIELDRLASDLLELCAGKLTLDAICRRLSADHGGVTFESVVGLLERFDEDRLVVFTSV